MPSNTRGALGLWAGLLAVLLVWGFLPLSTGHRMLLTGAVVLLVAASGLWLHRQSRQLQSRVGQQAPWRLPDPGFDGALVLVCGDSASMFADTSEYRQTHQGWYLATPTPEAFTLAVEWIAATAPMLLGQVSVALCVAPERHSDEALLRGEIHQWRRQFIRARRRLSRLPTVVLCGYLNGVIPTDTPTANDWFVRDGDSRLVGMSVYAEDGHGTTLARWAQQTETAPRMAQLLWLDSALAWLKAVVIDELHQPQAGVSAIPLSAIALRFTPLCGVENNLWQRAIREQTTLPVPTPAESAASRALPFPDCLLPGLPGRQGLTPTQRVGLMAGALVWLFGVAALLASFANNHRLIRSVGDDLAFYHHLNGTPPEPKIQAQQQLRRDEQLLARYQRQGAPLSLGLGLYPGQVLHPPVQRALSDWVPPTAPTPATPPAIAVNAPPQIIRLDSLSLFDSGKAVLKAGSTKMLVNSLVGIKAKPGWLIVVSGHTDHTGNTKLNQILSLQRAEAVRDWMRDTGDVPESCFAVQGYGDSRPMASNETSEGRAQNRRVEISLVPQADACHLPDTPPPSSQDGDGKQH